MKCPFLAETTESSMAPVCSTSPRPFQPCSSKVFFFFINSLELFTAVFYLLHSLSSRRISRYFSIFKMETQQNLDAALRQQPIKKNTTTVLSYFEKLYFQIKLLLWKRYAESTKSKYDLLKLFLPAVLFFALLLLIYAVFDGLFDPDGVEPFLVPFAFWIFIQRVVVQIMYEKSTRLQESMRMMGTQRIKNFIS